MSRPHCIRKHLSARNPRSQLGAQQERPAEFPMQTVRLLRRRRQPLPHHHRNEPPHPLRNRLIAEIIDCVCVLGKRLRERQDGIDVRVEHGSALMPGQVAQLDAQVAHGGAVGAGGGAQGAHVGSDEAVGEVAAGAEIEELEAVRRGVVEEVGPVGVRLHELELGDFAQAEAEDLGANPVALLLGEGLHLGDAGPVEVFGRQDLWAGGFGYDGRHVVGFFFIGEEGTEAFAHLGFADVIAFPGQFGSGVCDRFVEEEALGEKAGGGEEYGEVREVAVDGVGDTWVLDLDRDTLARGFKDGAVDLSDGCGCHWLFVKRREEVTPLCAEITCQDLITLGSRHVVGAVLDSLQNFVDRSRQHFRVFREHKRLYNTHYMEDRP